MAKMQFLRNICVPAQVYLILSIILLVVGALFSFSLLTLLVKLIFIAIWTWLLNFLCKSNYYVLSWILAILPFVFLLLSILIAVDIFSGLVGGVLAKKMSATTTINVVPSIHSPVASSSSAY